MSLVGHHGSIKWSDFDLWSKSERKKLDVLGRPGRVGHTKDKRNTGQSHQNGNLSENDQWEKILEIATIGLQRSWKA